MPDLTARRTGVTAVSRALDVLEAFKPAEEEVTLAELARRTHLHKTTVLRIARTLAAARYLVQLLNRSWRLGPAAGWLGARYYRGFDCAVVIEPALRELAGKTRESAAFFVREGNSRVCVARVDGPEATRYHGRLGEELPLDKGAVGRVLLAYCGEPGEPYESIRRSGHHMTFGEREAGVASVAAPVFGLNHVLAGAVAVTGPLARLGRDETARHVGALLKAASRLTLQLGGNRQIVRRLCKA
jgi:DNA-binding IclR family transcriptional regulator